MEIYKVFVCGMVLVRYLYLNGCNIISDILHGCYKRDEEGFRKQGRLMAHLQPHQKQEYDFITILRDCATPLGQKAVEMDIIETKMLNRKMIVNGGFKGKIADTLFMYNFPILYKPLPLPLGVLNSKNGRMQLYKPDFLLPYHYINGNGIVIEAVCMDDLEFDTLEKLHSARKTYGLYTVLITDGDISLRWTNPRKALGLVNEFWQIPGDGTQQRNIILHGVGHLLKKAEICSEVSMIELMLERAKLEIGDPMQLIRT